MSITLAVWHPSVRLLAGSVVALATVKLAWTIYRSRKNRNDPEYKDGIVYIHMFPRNITKKIVNLSPYAIKVETWCRMFKVPYQVVETTKFSPKERHIPWIVYNGQIQSDSSLIIELLQDRLNCNDNLDDLEKGIARTIMRMMDDSFALLYLYYRYFIKAAEYQKYFRLTIHPRFMQYMLLKLIGRKIHERCLLNGFARYGVDHVIKLGKQDLQALENILGDKQYIFGDTPTTVDATVFGHLSQILYPDLSYPWKEYIATDCPHLLEYCTRMKDKFWPDWDSLVEHDTFE